MTPISRRRSLAFRPGAEGGAERLEARLLLASLPEGFARSVVTAGLTLPTAMDFAPDGRLFVAEQTGAVRVVKGGTLLPAPALTVPAGVKGERGLVGLVLDPAFASNGFLYVHYSTGSAPFVNRISRFTVRGDAAVPGSERVLFEIPSTLGPNLPPPGHIGGALDFGKDGKLYVGSGDQGNGPNAQSLGNLAGKILRLNPDGGIPADNPFVATASGPNRAIWAVGFRNPFTLAIQPGTGRLLLNDVGPEDVEEINEGVAGANYGWPEALGVAGDPRFRDPLFSYLHGGTSCAITGATFYEPASRSFPASLVGDYFFADYCGGWIKTYDPRTRTVAPFASMLPGRPVDLDVGPDGALYYLGWDRIAGASAVYRVQYRPAQPPVISPLPTRLLVTVGQPATFTADASGDMPRSYQWQRDGVNLPGATSPTYTLAAPTMKDNGARFRVLVSNPFGQTTSTESTLAVTASRPPTAVIVAPSPGTTFRPGQTLAFAGQGTDPEDGVLPPSAFAWQVDYYLGNQPYPVIAPMRGVRNGSFAVPPPREPGWSFYRITLTVTDSSGLTATTTRDVIPAASFARPGSVGDYDGDGTADLTVFRPGQARWLSVRSGGSILNVVLGASDLIDIPAPGDYDGDGITDLVVFRPSEARWLGGLTGGGFLDRTFGAPNLIDIPAPGDYDGDGRTDVAVFRPGESLWLSLLSGGGVLDRAFGAPDLIDLPAPSDYDGDGRADLAVFRPSESLWQVQLTGGGILVRPFGAPGLNDLPAPGDYDGDGRADLAVFRPSEARWLSQLSGGGILDRAFGAPGLFDIPTSAPVGALVRLGLLARPAAVRPFPNGGPDGITPTAVDAIDLDGLSSRRAWPEGRRSPAPA